MNFDEALRIPKELSSTTEGHRKKYKMIIEALGYENVKECIPFSVEELRNAYKTDEHFNNLSLKIWDIAAGFTSSGGYFTLIRSRLTYLYREKCGVDTFSCSTGVCILKECARLWAEEESQNDRD